MTDRHIVAMGGGGFSMEPDNPALDDFVLSLARGDGPPRVCFVPTASGDAYGYVGSFYQAFQGRARTSHLSLFFRDEHDPRAQLLEQDVIYVGGGNTANMLAVWRLHGLDAALREAWEAGVVLAGLSAGALCWFSGGVTDSFGGLRRFDDGLGLLGDSFCPHYDGEPGRREAYHAAVDDRLPDGYAADDGAALHFVGTELREVVTSRPRARAYRVERRRDTVVEETLDVRLLA